MQNKKSLLLLEVTIVVLIVSIISFFLFRGYSTFLKAGRYGSDYLKLLLLSEEKICDLQIKEADNLITDDLTKEGAFNTPSLRWNLAMEESRYKNLKKGVLSINYSNIRKVSLDAVIYLISQSE